MLTRRDLFHRAAQATLAASAGPLLQLRAAADAAAPEDRIQYCFFSKHLPDLDWSDLGKAVKEAGFDGVDLTVRARGHVLPERAATDLPRAIEAIRSHGLSVPMVTTELVSASHASARPLLQAAAKGGVRYFKTGYWQYKPNPDVRAQVAAVGQDLE